MMACGSFALDVPNRNLRRCSFVSGEKEYKRDSEACIGISSLLTTAFFRRRAQMRGRKHLTILDWRCQKRRKNDQRLISKKGQKKGITISFYKTERRTETRWMNDDKRREEEEEVGGMRKFPTRGFKRTSSALFNLTSPTSLPSLLSHSYSLSLFIPYPPSTHVHVWPSLSAHPPSVSSSTQFLSGRNESLVVFLALPFASHSIHNDSTRDSQCDQDNTHCSMFDHW